MHSTSRSIQSSSLESGEMEIKKNAHETCAYMKLGINACPSINYKNIYEYIPGVRRRK